VLLKVLALCRVDADRHVIIPAVRAGDRPREDMGMTDEGFSCSEVVPDRASAQEAMEAETLLGLLNAARDRDPEAWRRLVRISRPLVRFWCGQRGVRGQDAEDISQEVLAAVSAGLADFRQDRPGDTFCGWLCGITRNKIFLHFRRNQGHPQAEGGEQARQNLEDLPDRWPGPGEEERDVSPVYRSALRRVRGEFTERTWQAFWLTVIEGRSPAELADELDMLPATIRQAKSRVLRRLKKELGGLLG
jgi:RNA polymerase sigma-70 factor, ECF subfamily